MKDEGEGRSLNREGEGGCSPTVSEASLHSGAGEPESRRAGGWQETASLLFAAAMQGVCLRPQVNQRNDWPCL